MQLKISDYQLQTKQTIEEKKALEDIIPILKEEIIKVKYKIQEDIVSHPLNI